MCVIPARLLQSYVPLSAWAPHMWAALSIAPNVTNMPDQFSVFIMVIAASATQVSPPRCGGSLPGTNLLPSTGYSHDGNAALVP